MPKLGFLRIALLALLVVIFQGTWALAGTTGALSGAVVADGQPLAGAKVTATSPSESVSTTTDATGHFIFVSLVPDTYTVVVNKDGYDSVSQAGLTVIADNTQTTTITTQKSVKVIGTVPVRAAAELVKPGTTADVYSVNARSAAKMTPLGGGGGADNAYSAIASLPGVYVPVGQSGWYQNVFIRGGDYDQVGYEYDGVPVNRAFDNYPSSTASSLGQQSLQLYTGAAPANAESQGLAGFINQVIRTGTYPGFGTVDAAIGGPSLYNKLNLEVGGATPNRNFSYYVGLGGYNLRPRTFDQSNGASLTSTYGIPFVNNTALDNGPGVSPNGYILAPFNMWSTYEVSDRETVANFHLGIPHHNDSGKDDIQFLYSTSLLRNPYYSSAQDFGIPFLTANSAGVSGVPGAFIYYGGSQYNGNLGDTFTSGPVSNIVTYNSPSSGGAAVGSNIPSTMRDSSENGQGIGKIQYQHNIGSNAFLRVYAYSYYSWWFLHGDISNNQNYVACCPGDYELETHSRGASAEFQDQINAQNLLGLQFAYTAATSTRDNNTQALAAAVGGARTLMAVLVNTASPRSGICYNINGGVPTPASCEPFALTATNPNPQLTATWVDYATAQAGGYTAAPAGFEYQVVENGPWATYNTVKPKFTSASLQDQYKASDKLLFNVGVRVDRFEYDGASTAGGTRDFWFNAWNASQCVLSTPGNKPVDKSFLGLDPTQSCSLAAPKNGVGWITPTFTNVSSPVFTYTTTQPRIGGTYTLSSDDVLRFSYGKYVQAPNAAFEQYNSLDQNLPARLGNTFNFYAYGFTTPGHQLGPAVSYNSDFSWEHRFKGSDVSFKLTPFLRKTHDQYQQFYLDQITNFVSGLPVGNQTSSGVEFQLAKGDFSANGLSGLFSYTYTHSYITLSKLANGGTVFSGINNSISKYNAYTSACSGNTTNPACGGGVDTKGNVTAPCYTPAGIADAGCAAGDIANPYWNAPVQSLFDPNASYVPFDIIPGGYNSSINSFEVPNVATLILNFKHDKWSLTPSFQYHSGGVYGAPLQTQGVNPSADPINPTFVGCQALASGTVAGDPRYPYGAPGGLPYDAHTCEGGLLIPNPYTGAFDSPGAFRDPSQLTAHLQLSYEATPRLTLIGGVFNIINTCTGGSSAAWTQGATNKVCGYSLPGYGPIPSVGNFYNPSDSVQQIVKYPYMQNYGISPTSYALEAKITL